DGWLVVAVGNDGQWQRFCQAAERPDLAADPRFQTNTGRVQHRDVLVPLVETAMRLQTTGHWAERLLAAEVPHAPVWNYAELFAHPQTAARGWRGMVTDPQGRPVDLVRAPCQTKAPTIPAARAPPTLTEPSERW